MNSDIDWVIIKGLGNREIGAIGFIGNKAAVIAAFYDDADGDQDGHVSAFEWLATKLSPIKVDGASVTEVAMAARLDMRVLQRDPSFYDVANEMFLNFARGLVVDGVYAVYFSRGIKMASGAVAARLSDSLIKNFVIRKGLEKAVHKVYNGVLDR